MPVSYPEVTVVEEDNEHNERDNDNTIKKKKKKKEAKGNRFLIPFVSKAKKRIVSKITRNPLSPASSGFWKRVCFCGAEPTNSLEWSSSSNPDPEDVNFTLRVLLQTNDFFSKDSNPHLCL